MTNQKPKDKDDAMLDDLFDLAHRADAEPGDALMMRILDDADAVQAQGAAVPMPAQGGLFAAIMDMIGGWKAVGGLATATATGLWIGISPPTAFEDYTSGYFTSAANDSSAATIDSLLGFESLFLEDDV